MSGARGSRVRIERAIVALALLLTTVLLPASAALGLADSTASNYVAQPQPAPGSCHAIGSGLASRPDRRCTPGALNPLVTQATIHRTICVPGWTASVRPPESITAPEKRASMAAYGDRGPVGDYEYDHFVPLELGGATNDRRNLWPEPGAAPNPKDAVENALKRSVCRGQTTLAQAQRAIVTNWLSLERAAGQRQQASPPPPSAPRCSASAQFNSHYEDYDIYVHSNQPDRTVTVTGPGGQSASWRTDAGGYADVYFHAGASAAGETVTVRAGAATCSTRL